MNGDDRTIEALRAARLSAAELSRCAVPAESFGLSSA